MKLAIIWLALAACGAESAEITERAATENVPEATTTGTVALWQCGGDKLYFEWQCDDTVGKWNKVYVGSELRNCGYPQEIVRDGRITTCHESYMYTCGGGPDELCQDDNTCDFPPGPCRKRVIDPPPCCIK